LPVESLVLVVDTVAGVLSTRRAARLDVRTAYTPE